MSFSFSFTDPFVIDFLVLFYSSKSFFPFFNFLFLLNSLSSNSHISNKSLNFGGFLSQWCIRILLAFEGSSDNILFNEGSNVIRGLLTFTL